MNDAEKWDAIAALIEAHQKVIEKAAFICVQIEYEYQKAKEALNRAS